ncbi:MAG TPA: hypothetical protein VMX13_02805 [Sedimentisphaerales bacterium]|nr:hypothetical protein [Sedimentisphaerales bacterium]
MVRLMAYEQVVRWYMRYVLLRCSFYTNSRKTAEKMTYYTLLTTCSLVDELKHGWQVGRLIDFMVDVIAQDIAGHGSHSKRECPLRCRQLFADKRVRKVAEFLNSLDGFTREVLVLHYVEMMSIRTIAEFYDRPVCVVKMRLSKANARMAEHLYVLWQGGVDGKRCLWASELRHALDWAARKPAAAYVLSYLSKWERDNRAIYRRLADWRLN